MYKNILIPTDGSELAGKAVEHGIVLAKENGAKVTAVVVTEPFRVLSLSPDQLEYTRDEYQRHSDAVAEKALGVVAAAAGRADVACETRHIENDNVYQGIIDTAAAKACDLIVMASHGRHGLSAVVLGSVTVKVLMHSKIPVLVYR
jgi:nucleotide-binding universal stress UspA family protein